MNTTYVIETRDDNGQWDERHAGDVLEFATEAEAEAAADELSETMGWNRDEIRVVEREAE